MSAVAKSVGGAVTTAGAGTWISVDGWPAAAVVGGAVVGAAVVGGAVVAGGAVVVETGRAATVVATSALSDLS